VPEWFAANNVRLQNGLRAANSVSVLVCAGAV